MYPVPALIHFSFKIENCAQTLGRLALNFSSQKGVDFCGKRSVTAHDRGPLEPVVRVATRKDSSLLAELGARTFRESSPNTLHEEVESYVRENLGSAGARRHGRECRNNSGVAPGPSEAIPDQGPPWRLTGALSGRLCPVGATLAGSSKSQAVGRGGSIKIHPWAG
jgi:hypothetical protein